MTTSQSQARMNAIIWNASQYTGQRSITALSLVEGLRDLHAGGYYAEVLELAEQHNEYRDLPEIRNVVGLAKLGLQRHDEALEDFERAGAALSEKLAATLGNQLTVCLTQERYARAEELALAARSIAPQMPLAHVNVLAVYCWQEKTDQLPAVIDDMDRLFPDWRDSSEFWKFVDVDLTLKPAKTLLETRR